MDRRREGVYATKAWQGSGDKAPLILDLGTGQEQVVRFSCSRFPEKKRAPVTLGGHHSQSRGLGEETNVQQP